MKQITLLLTAITLFVILAPLGFITQMFYKGRAMYLKNVAISIDQNGNAVPSGVYKLIGGPNPSLNWPLYANMTAVYTTGMTSVPKELKIAILDQINYGYENRGMDVDDMGICEKTWRVCQRWTRLSPIL